MKRNALLLLLFFACNFITQAQLIIPSTTAPTIDGIIDENDSWGEDWISQDSIRGPTDFMTSQFQLSHDNEKIYLIVKVTDTTPSNDEYLISSSYERDCIEAFFSMKASDHEIGDYEIGDHQIRFQRASDNNNFIDGYSGGPDTDYADIMYTVISDDNGYVAEMAFPISFLVNESNFDGENFRFEIASVDNTTGEDGGRTQQRFWNSKSDQQWNNTTYFGEVQLEQKRFVSFTISDGTSPLENATIALAGNGTMQTDADGIAIFSDVESEEGINYSITADSYFEASGSIDVLNANVEINRILISTSASTYPLTFFVTDEGSNAIEGARTALTGYGPQVTNANGEAQYSTVLPANDISYTITKIGYEPTEGTLTVIDSAVYENIILETPRDYLMATTSISTDKGYFYDAGGENQNYENNENYTMTFLPETMGHSLQFTFENFRTEGCCDQLLVYNGSSTNTPLIGQYSGSELPAQITAKNSEGALTFLFDSDGSATETGWKAKISSLELNTYAVNFTITDGTNPIENASITLSGYFSETTNIEGQATIPYIFSENNLAFTITANGYNTATGTIDVMDEDISIEYELIESSDYTFLEVPHANAPQMDGIIDDNDPWNASWIYQNNNTEQSSTFDMNSRFQITHDGNKLYILVEIEDETPSYDTEMIPNTWDRDCIGIYFSMKASDHDNGDYTDGDYQIRFQRANNSDEYIDGSNSVSDLLESNAIEYSILSNEQGYIAEIAFDISSLAGNSDFDGSNFRFNIGATDNTSGESGGSTQRKYWGSNSLYQWNNTSYFDNLRLGDVHPNNLTADFTSNEINGESPLMVHFHDESTGNPLTWSWDFNNDGIEDANTQNPTCIYTESGNYSVSLTISNTNGTDKSTKQNYITVTTSQIIVPLSSPPTIDGRINVNDPWDNSWIKQNAITDNSTTFDMNSRFQIKHDNDKLYLLVDVNDSTPNNDNANIPSSFFRDAIELFFSMKATDHDFYSYTNGDHHFICQREDDNNEYIEYYSGNNNELLDAIDFAVESNSMGYLYEIAFPIEKLALESNFDGDNFRFDISSSDNTDGTNMGRTQKRFWNSNSDLQWNNTSYLGDMILGDNQTTNTSFPITFITVDKNQNPIEGATINLSGYISQRTNSKGETIFSNILPANGIIFTALKTGYRDFSGSISVNDTGLEIKLKLIEGENSIFDKETNREFENAILVYPNPAVENLNILIKENIQSLVLINLQGQIAYTFHEELVKNSTYQINVSKLQKGIYFIKADSLIERIIIN